MTKHIIYFVAIITIVIFATFEITQPQGISWFNPHANDPVNVYAYTNAGMYSQAVRNALPRVYVPNSLDNTVSVIDPAAYQVVDTFKTGKIPQHVVPAYDLKTLYVLNDAGNSVTPIDPVTAKPQAEIKIDDPYNLYFTPDGQYAIDVCEARKQLQFLDPHTMALHDAIPVQCKGVNHMDFTADGRYAIITCEYSGQLLKLDVVNHKVMGYLTLKMDDPKKLSQDVRVGNLTLTINDSKPRTMPQDVRISPDGRIFYVADMAANGVFLIDPETFTQIGFITTGVGTHSIYPSRDGKLFYVANRGCNSMKCHPHPPGSISVIDPYKQQVVATWPIPGGGSPDMGNVSGDGKELWLSGRFDSEVYVFDTATGNLTHRIPVGQGPHGLTVWPQPGRYSLGHTGNMR